MKMIQDKWNGKPVAYLEQVHAFPTDGRSSAFKFGTNYGVWQGFLGALDIECNLVSPQVWMKPLGLSKDKKLRKNEIKAMAQKIVDDQKDEPKHRQEEYRIQELRVGLETICVAMRYPEYGTEAHS